PPSIGGTEMVAEAPARGVRGGERPIPPRGAERVHRPAHVVLRASGWCTGTDNRSLFRAGILAVSTIYVVVSGLHHRDAGGAAMSRVTLTALLLIALGSPAYADVWDVQWTLTETGRWSASIAGHSTATVTSGGFPGGITVGMDSPAGPVSSIVHAGGGIFGGSTFPGFFPDMNPQWRTVGGDADTNGNLTWTGAFTHPDTFTLHLGTTLTGFPPPG